MLTAIAGPMQDDGADNCEWPRERPTGCHCVQWAMNEEVTHHADF
ncbi:hypothetical protein [Sphingobium algorifonticola]|nr:hypothetical protein [Sphingobium algorifonticola]